jgi:hypothetical protein
MELVFKEKPGFLDYQKAHIGRQPDDEYDECWQTDRNADGYYISVLSRWTGFERRDIESALVRIEDGKRTEFYLCTSFDARTHQAIKDCKTSEDLVALWKKTGNWFSAPEGM